MVVAALIVKVQLTRVCGSYQRHTTSDSRVCSRVSLRRSLGLLLAL